MCDCLMGSPVPGCVRHGVSSAAVPRLSSIKCLDPSNSNKLPNSLGATCSSLSSKRPLLTRYQSKVLSAINYSKSVIQKNVPTNRQEAAAPLTTLNTKSTHTLGVSYAIFLGVTVKPANHTATVQHTLSSFSAERSGAQRTSVETGLIRFRTATTSMLQTNGILTRAESDQERCKCITMAVNTVYSRARGVTSVLHASDVRPLVGRGGEALFQARAP